MADVNGKNKDGTIDAYIVSANHHGNVINNFAFGFLNSFAILHAGGLAAGVAISSTTVGRAIRDQWPNMSIWTLIFFAAGFALATSLMIMVFKYSLGKYQYYRSLARGNSKEPNNWDERNASFHVGGKIILGILIVDTLAAVLTAVFMIAGVELPGD